MRVLKRLRPKKLLQNDFYVFDTETGTNKNNRIEWQLEGRPEKFIFGCIVGKNFRKVLFSVDEFKAEFLHSRYKNKKVFAHNAEYDLNVLYGNIFELDPKAIFNGKFICATNGNCVFADSLNIYKTSVKELSKMLGMDKIGMNDGYTVSDWYDEKIKAKDINACFVDCEIVYESLVRVFEDAGDIKITQASLSMTYYRRFHQPYDIEHNENNAFFFDSYYGGRTECFKIGKTYASVIDVNSMYPDRMKNILFPDTRKLKVSEKMPVNHFLKNILYKYEGCIYCTVIHKKTKYGFLPYKSNGKLLFPFGRLTGCWNFNEIRFALDHNAIIIQSITRVVFAPAMFSPFKYFVDFLYHKRFETNNELEIYRIKIFMNSLYGKFAQRITEETIYIPDLTKAITMVRELQKQGILLKIQPFNAERNDCFLILKATKKIDISFCIPSFASYITSAARIVLLQKLIELQDKRPVYCDTDSIFFEINDGTVKTGSRLGEWKIENKIVTEIKGLKNYVYVENNVEKIRLKGVPKKAEKIAENTYKYFNLVKSKEAIRRGLIPGILTERKKVITGKYDKRIVFETGETELFEII